MQIRNYNEGILLVPERITVRRCIAKFWNLEYSGSTIMADDLPVFLAYMKLEAIPLETLNLIIKACK